MIVKFSAGRREYEIDENLLPLVPCGMPDSQHVQAEYSRQMMAELAESEDNTPEQWALQTIVHLYEMWMRATDRIHWMETALSRDDEFDAMLPAKVATREVVG